MTYSLFEGIKEKVDELLGEEELVTTTPQSAVEDKGAVAVSQMRRQISPQHQKLYRKFWMSKGFTLQISSRYKQNDSQYRGTDRQTGKRNVCGFTAFDNDLSISCFQFPIAESIS